MSTIQELEKLAKLVRYFILVSTTEAGSGHPTSSLSAADLMTVLMFSGVFRFDTGDPGHPNNDRLLFSKGHASPLLYALWTVAGQVTEQELMTLRKFGSPLEGHPTSAFKYSGAATGSLGQGLSIGFGLALNAKYIDKLPYRTYVLLGDSEMAEGSQWETIQLAAHYKLDNLIAVLDVNRLGQRGETMYGHDVHAYEKRVSSFGWETIVINGHDLAEITRAYEKAGQVTGKPVMIIARTIKGKGVSFIEDRDGWHGKALDRGQLAQALKELGEVETSIRGKIREPENKRPSPKASEKPKALSYPAGKAVATRKAYGNALERLYPGFPDMVVLDAEVSNSTYSEIFQKAYPERFFEMYIAEQNMVGASIGLHCAGKLPFVSTFAAFFTRAFDQIRMSRYSAANIIFSGSHAGVSIGEDGPSQMGLEDIAMFRSILDSVVFYPCDAVSAEKLVEEASRHKGIVYIRTTRKETPVIYGPDEKFPAGGNKVLRQSKKDSVAVISAGITVFECLAAHESLDKEDINVRVIDLYCIKPISSKNLLNALGPAKAVITVEDHLSEGGLGEAVRSALEGSGIPVHSLSVMNTPKSGKPEELLDYEGISKNAIAKKVRQIL